MTRLQKNMSLHTNATTNTDLIYPTTYGLIYYVPEGITKLMNRDDIIDMILYNDAINHQLLEDHIYDPHDIQWQFVSANGKDKNDGAYLALYYTPKNPPSYQLRFNEYDAITDIKRTLKHREKVKEIVRMTNNYLKIE